MMLKDASLLVRMPRSTLNTLGECSQDTGIARAEIMRRLLDAWMGGARIRGLPRLPVSPSRRARS
jgi:hypothetical protein